MVYYLLSYILIIACPLSEKKISAFVEKDGTVAVEAEHFAFQELTNTRKWYVISADSQHPELASDEAHYSSASGQAYLEILPDTRTNHQEELIHGENFSNEPGRLGVLHYYVMINNPGKYFVWVRAYSTGSEDNGLHVGLNDQWVQSGQRMQWCEGKNQWTWASKQRTKEEHCGVEQLIYLEIPTAGLQKVSFSMREDGFEFDKWILSKYYEVPENAGPPESPVVMIKP